MQYAAVILLTEPTYTIYGPVHEISMLVAYAQTHMLAYPEKLEVYIFG